MTDRPISTRAQRLPSQVLADNLRLLRAVRRYRQDDVAERMAALGHVTWSRATVSEIERYNRGVVVDELPSLAFVLGTSVVDLLDPTVAAGAEQSTISSIALSIAPSWYSKFIRGSAQLTMEWRNGHYRSQTAKFTEQEVRP